MANGNGTVKSRMLTLLRDGRRHTAEELHACLRDELGPISNITPHLSALRQMLRPKGEDVLSHRIGDITYYWIADLMGNPYRG